MSYLLATHEGFLVHSSGFGDDRGAIVFAGVSGSGKTTTARKLPYENVLSDDQVALRRIDGRWMAFSLPFVGEYGRPPLPRSTALKRVLLLQRATSGVRFLPLHEAIATTRLLACVPWFVPRAAPARSLLPLVSDVARVAGISELHVGRDEPIRCLVEELVECASA